MDNYPPGADNSSAPFNQKSPSDSLLAYVDDSILHETDLYPEWMMDWSATREPSTFFGMISNPELFSVQMKRDATQEQVWEAAKELRKRFYANSRVSEAVDRMIQNHMDES
jgi:hypothetical protein